jgi:hypothetical protein
MLIGKKIFARIDEIVEAAYLGFLFDVIGDDFFSQEQKTKIESLGLLIGRKPLIELLYMLVRNRPTEGYRDDKTLGQLLEEIGMSGVLPIINDTQQYTVDHAKAALMTGMEDVKKELQKRVKREILRINKEFKDLTVTQRYETPKLEEKKKHDYTLALFAALAGVGTLIQSNFARLFSSELTDLINGAVADEAVTEAMLNQTKPGDTLVYKLTKDDGRVCDWCHRFYTDNGMAIVYTLAQLQANGTNDGKPKSQWKPVVGKTHPRCRCQLFRVHKHN